MLIADDFGLGRNHDRIILDLLDEGRIDGTSVMIDGAMSANDLDHLRRLREKGAQVGLHLNLTHAFAAMGAYTPLGRLLGLCLSGRTPDWAEAEFRRQAETFHGIFGSLPDYYDGHQHCHVLPGLARFAAGLPRAGACWMRLPLPATPSGLALNLRSGGPKVLLIATLARLARRDFEKQSWPTNRDFSGFLRLERPQAVSRWLPELLRRAPPDGLVMVHPGAASDPEQCPGHDPRSREIEAAILRGPLTPASGAR